MTLPARLVLMTAALAAASRAFGAPAVDPGIPSYEPRDAAPPAGAGYVLTDGTVQIVAFRDFEGAIRALNGLFAKSHPSIRFKVIPADSAAVIDSLTFDATAFAPIPVQFAGGQQYAHYAHGPVFGVRVAHASLNPEAKVSPLAVIVNGSNPLRRLSMDQLKRILTQGGRATDITEWNQVGVTGGTARREIHRIGLPWMDQYPAEDPSFGEVLFHRTFGGAEPASNYESVPRYDEVVERVSQDPLAIGVTAINRVTSAVKAVELTTTGWSTPVRGTEEEITSGAYPLDRFVYINVRLVSGKPFDPLAREYLRMVLSKEGQAAIAGDARGYLPLNSTEVGVELAKLR